MNHAVLAKKSAVEAKGKQKAAPNQLRLGKPDDSLEREASRAADQVLGCAPTTPYLSRIEAPAERGGSSVPPIVHEALRSPGQPLDDSTRAFMGTRFGHDFGKVKVHTGGKASASASAMGALAFTVGEDIVFNTGQYAPATSWGRCLVAHELAHVLQQSSGSRMLQRQTSPSPPPAPREDFVFIMGEDRKGSGNPFYTMALRFYKAHVPKATFVTAVRNLTDLLDYIRTNVQNPIGNLYVISHANEDGTLSFGLNTSDKDAHLSFVELRDAIHPKGSGGSTLPTVSSQIDSQTRIHIKGCDIGRTKEMVELVDEAFGGAGTVTAPTHEQEFGYDPRLARTEETRVRTEKMAEFAATLPELPPAPAAIDPKLKGDQKKKATEERKAALAARAQAVKERQELTKEEQKRIAPEVAQAAEEVGTFEAFSGPMFQRPGKKLFTAAELAPEVLRLYGHLSVKQQARLVQRLVAPDPRSASLADHQGTFQQHGQRAYRKKAYTQQFNEPRTLAEATRMYGKNFRKNQFKAEKMNPPTISGSERTVEIAGRFTPRGEDPSDGTLTYTEAIFDDDSVLASGKAQLSNPDRYTWQVQTAHKSNGTTTKTAVAERVIAYLHHGGLDPSAHDHFTRPESDPNFYTTSTVAPPPAAPVAPSGGKP